jgi:hypothetical protein
MCRAIVRLGRRWPIWLFVAHALHHDDLDHIEMMEARK